MDKILNPWIAGVVVVILFAALVMSYLHKTNSCVECNPKNRTMHTQEFQQPFKSHQPILYDWSIP